MLHPRDRHVGIVTDRRFLNHNPGPSRTANRSPWPYDSAVPHPDNPMVLDRTLQLIHRLGFDSVATMITPTPATESQLRSFHTPDYIHRMDELSRAAGDDRPAGHEHVGPGSADIARLAVGAAITAVDAVMEGAVRHGYALVRPGGHHAFADKIGGFSIFNSMVIAAKHARLAHKLRRVAIVDWDATHGSGTQEAFSGDPGTLVISIHEEDLYPSGWGEVVDVGVGRARGSTVNIPLPPGAGARAVIAAMERIVDPLVAQFQPEIILVSAGQNGSVMDPTARLCLTTAAYRQMTSLVRTMADIMCDGRLVLIQEGGASPAYTPYCNAAIIEGLIGGVGSALPVDEPFGPRAESMRPTRELTADCAAVLDRVVALHAHWWYLD